MNILQQIWTYSNVFLTFLVNLVHTISLVSVIDHDMVAIGETAQFFTVVVVAHQFIAVKGDGGEAVDVATLVFGNEIVKEQMVQTTSKKIVRSSEKQELCACVPHTHYVEIRGFMRATACLRFCPGYGLLIRKE